MHFARGLILAVLAMLVVASAVRADDDYQKKLEEQEKQQDRDRENYSSLHEAGNFAAIAYSPATGKYGYSFDFGNLSDARKKALAQCKASDARVVVWARGGYCALAKGKDGSFGWGHGSTAAQAQAHALDACKKRTTDCKILTCVYSGR